MKEPLTDNYFSFDTANRELNLKELKNLDSSKVCLEGDMTTKIITGNAKTVTAFLNSVFKNSALRKVSSLGWADITLISKKVLSTVKPISDLLVFCPILPTYSKSLYFTRHFVSMIISYQWKFHRNLCKSNSALHYIVVIKRLFLPIIWCNKWSKWSADQMKVTLHICSQLINISTKEKTKVTQK